MNRSALRDAGALRVTDPRSVLRQSLLLGPNFSVCASSAGEGWGCGAPQPYLVEFGIYFDNEVAELAARHDLSRAWTSFLKRFDES